MYIIGALLLIVVAALVTWWNEIMDWLDQKLFGGLFRGEFFFDDDDWSKYL